MANHVLDDNIAGKFTPEQAKTYFSIYVKTAKEAIDGIEKDVQTGNLDVIKKRAHKLKGSSLTVGATDMKDKAHEIEDTAASGQPVDPAKVQELKSSFQELQNLLKEKYNLTFA